MQDGQRIPAPGRLYYRGIELTDIVEAHRSAGTFGFEEVAYLLLMGYLPSRSELAYFDKIMNQARKLPEGFTEGMIMRHPSHNIMNELARSVLSLYSYDPDPDNTSIDNMLLQSVKLIGYFPSIVANAYAVQRHYFHGDSLHIHFQALDNLGLLLAAGGFQFLPQLHRQNHIAAVIAEKNFNTLFLKKSLDS